MFIRTLAARILIILIAIIPELQITIHRQTPLLQLQTPTKSKISNQSDSAQLDCAFVPRDAVLLLCSLVCEQCTVCNVVCVHCGLFQWSLFNHPAFLCLNASILYWNCNFVCVNVALHHKLWIVFYFTMYFKTGEDNPAMCTFMYLLIVTLAASTLCTVVYVSLTDL